MKPLMALVLAVYLACMSVATLSAAEAEVTDNSDQIYTLSGDADVVTGTFEYVTFDQNVESYDYFYDESWFAADSYAYNHGLTRMSLRVAMAGFGHSPSESAESPQDNAARLVSLLGDLGFCADPNDGRLVVDYPVPTADSIGYLITSKQLNDGTTLVLVNVRSGGYLSEWGSNFAVGKTVSHEGFQSATDRVLAALAKYLDANVSGGGCKVWLCGYSRGAAVVNLMAAALDRGELKQVAPRDVYAYCFECPRITTDPEVRDALYANIVNVVNPLDLVPRLVMSAWGYDRYGTTYVLPSIDTTVDYERYAQAMRKQYESILAARTTPSKDELDALTLVVPGEVAILDRFANAMAGYLKSAAQYKQLYQDKLVSIAAETMSSDSGDISSSIGELMFGEGMLQTGFRMIYPVEARLAERACIDYRAFLSHFPELTMAWLDALDTLDATSWRTYRLVTVKGANTVEVVQAGGAPFASLVAKDGLGVDGTPAFTDDDGNVVLVLPGDGTFNINIAASAKGEVVVSCVLYDVVSGLPSDEGLVGTWESNGSAAAPFGSVEVVFSQTESPEGETPDDGAQEEGDEAKDSRGVLGIFGG